jgi:hypothetical protein
MSSQIRFSTIYKSFDQSMRALYELQTSIQETVGNTEWKVMEEYYKEALSLTDDYNPDEVQTILNRLIKIDVEEETLNFKNVLEAVNVAPEDILDFENDRTVFLRNVRDGLFEFAGKDPERANKFLRAFLKVQRSEPLTSEVSRHGILLSAVSQFEIILLHLLREYYVQFKQDFELNLDLSVEELDVEISKRLDDKFKSISRKLNFLVERFPMGGEFDETKIKEIIARRNVLTHRGGRADKTYTDFNKNIAIGERLRISQNYIKEALEHLHLWGFVLYVKVWNKLGAPDQKAVSQLISSSTMQLIRDNRLEFCARVCQQIRSELKSRNSKDILTINYAICLERLGKKQLMLRALSSIRQTPRKTAPRLKVTSSKEPFHPVLLMAVNALEGKVQYALDLLERAANAGEVTFLDLDYWVIFDYLRDEPRFDEIENKLESKIKIV